jgi:rhodanese-related sulfurtransferase
MAEIGEIQPLELKARRDRHNADDKLIVLDVREPEEIAIAPFPDALHIPMGDIPSRLTELDPDAEWVVVCHHGVRSAQVAMYLAHMGFARVSNLIGGIDAWSLTADPSTPRY